MKTYEVIREIKNSCSGNQMRDIFFEEVETDDPVSYVRTLEPKADSIIPEEQEGGLTIRVISSGLVTVYTLTEI